MAEGVLVNVAASLVEMLVSAAFEETGLLCGVNNEFEKLVDTTNIIKGVLVDAEQKMAVDNSIKAWLKQLGDAFFAADDLVDKFHTEAMLRRVMSGNKFTRQVRLFFSSSNQLVFRIKMGHQIKDVREKLDEIRVNRSFQLNARVEETVVAGGSRMRETCSYVGEGEVIGRESEKKEIIRLLVEMEFEKDVSFIPIVGIGGLGKTTLAQYVFNNEKVQNHFQLKMWVCVSDVFDVKSLVEKIIKSDTPSNLENLELEQLQNQLRTKLSGKKYLLVLDDVWNEDGEKWCKLEMLLKCGVRGSRVLVTTRSEMVARITQTDQPFIVQGLSKDMSWSLFKRMTFERDQEPKEGSKVMELGMEVVEKCKGVPLAIRTIGRLLQSRLWQSQNPEKELSWFLNSEFAKVDQNENDILPTLKLSYDHLPSHLKHSFAFCRLFSKDHDINVRELIQLWMAQGFIKCSDDKNQCLEDIGYKYFITLLWRSFFQEPKTDDFGEIISCKMHDLMHDLAILVAGEDSVIINQNTKISIGKKLHVSFVDFDFELETNNSHEISDFFSQQKRLRSFLLHNCKELSFSKLEDTLSKFECLRALSQPSMNIEVLPKNLCELVHLRYLNLSFNSKLKMLPSCLVRLQNLQTLNLMGCYGLVKLPQDMKKLANLRHLMIEYCDSLIEMPPEFGYMTSLHTLDRFVASESSGFHELSNLINNLQGGLSIRRLRHANQVASKSTAQAPTLKRGICEGKHDLQWLRLKWEEVDDSNDFVENDEMLLEGLQPPSSVKELEVWNFMGVRFGGWLSSFDNLVRLNLYKCRNCQHLPKLHQLSSLKDLHLKDVEAEYICSSANDDDDDFESDLFFPSLVNLTIKNCPNLKWWWWKGEKDGNEIRSFPRLSNLTLINCPNLTSMPLFPCIERLEVNQSSSRPLEETCKMMRGIRNIHGVEADNTQPNNISFLKSIKIFISPDLTSLLEGIGNLPSLKDIQVSHCSNLTSLLEGTANLPSLENIQVFYCSNLTSLLEGIGNLPSLKSIDVGECPNLTSFPKNLLNRDKVSITRCPKLDQRYSN